MWIFLFFEPSSSFLIKYLVGNIGSRVDEFLSQIFYPKVFQFYPPTLPQVINYFALNNFSLIRSIF